jgi:hypothetical protein
MVFVMVISGEINFGSESSTSDNAEFSLHPNSRMDAKRSAVGLFMVFNDLP